VTTDHDFDHSLTMHDLIGRFARAGLDLRLADAPFTGSSDIFQMDIRRARPHDVRSEHFLAWMGKEDNVVTVQGVDPRERQLVLFVREARRSFTEHVPRHVHQSFGTLGSPSWRARLAGLLNVRLDLVEVRGGEAFVRRTTSPAGRHLLVGCDERQLFMCELPRPVSTVKQAHEALRPALVPRGDKAIRQGEWFFVVPSKGETEDLEQALRGSLTVVRKGTSINAAIPRAGKPHMVDELVVVRGSVFVRGAVRHPDHKTIRLRFWHRVHKNLEVDRNRSVLGGTWID
jgi:hypothetical protein